MRDDLCLTSLVCCASELGSSELIIIIILGINRGTASGTSCVSSCTGRKYGDYQVSRIRDLLERQEECQQTLSFIAGVGRHRQGVWCETYHMHR